MIDGYVIVIFINRRVSCKLCPRSYSLNYIVCLGNLLCPVALLLSPFVLPIYMVADLVRLRLQPAKCLSLKSWIVKCVAWRAACCWLQASRLPKYRVCKMTEWTAKLPVVTNQRQGIWILWFFFAMLMP